MVAVIRALTWEFYRENRWWWICLVVAVVALGALAAHTDKPANTAELPIILFFIVLFGEAKMTLYFLFMKHYNSRTRRLGFPLHLYTKPLACSPMVAWRLTLSILTVMALHGIVTLTFRLSSNLSSPWLKPALLLSLVVVWGQALVWFFPRMQRMQTLCAAVALLPVFALLAVWVKYFVEEPLSSLMNRVRYATLIPGLVFAYAVAWLAVMLERRSVSLNALFRSLRWQRSRAVHPAPNAVRTPMGMLFRIEMQRKGWQWPLANIMGFLMLVLLHICRVLPPKFFVAFLTFGGIINVFALPILIGFVFGQQGKTRQMQIESYKAAKPVTNRQFLAVTLLASLTSLTLAWIAFLSGPILTWIIIGRFGRMESWHQINQVGLPSGPWELTRILGILVTVWTLMALSATVMLAGRRWLAITVWLGIWLIPATLGMVVEALPASVEEIAGSVIMITLMACLFGGTLAAFGIAIYRKLLGKWAVLGSMAAYGVLIFLLARTPDPQGDIVFLMFQSAVLTLPVLPVAAAPLALAWNRHR